MAIFYRVGDTQPPLRVVVEDLGLPIDITNLQVMVTWTRPDGTVIAERAATKVAPFTSGLTDYGWLIGDFTVQGPYQAMVRLKAVDNSYYSLTDPPILEIEVLPNPVEVPSTVLDDTIPYVSSYDIAVHLRIPVSELDGPYARASISRARSLAYVLTQMWRRPGALATRDQWLMKELVMMLATREYVTSPTITYGPFKKENIGSYGYEIKDAVTTKLGMGTSDIDGLIDYFHRLFVATGTNIDVAFPDWYQPATTQIWNPLDPRGFPGDSGGFN